MKIKLLQILSVMTLVMLITVAQATDAFAFRMFTDDGATQIDCLDGDACDDEPFAGIITLLDDNTAVCDLVASQQSAATKTALGTGTMLELDKDLNCTASPNTLGTLIYSISDVDFSGADIVCTTDAGGGATSGSVNVKFWISDANTHFDKQQLLFDVTSDNLGNIPWAGLFAAASPGGMYSFTMETTMVHDVEDQVNITTFDLTVSCEPEEGETEIVKTSDCEKDFGIYTLAPVTCTFTITYTNTDPNAPPVRILDTLRAEFQVVDADANTGVVTLLQTQVGSATTIQWDLPAGPILDATLVVDIETVENPGKGHGKKSTIIFKPTSCGPLPINDGATVFEFDPSTGMIKLDGNGDPVVIIGPSNTIVAQAVDSTNDATKDCEVPKTIQNLTISQGGLGELILDWDDNGDADLELYNIYRIVCPNPKHPPTLDFLTSINPPTVSSYTDINLVPATYCYIVTAENLTGESTDSKKVSQFIYATVPSL